MYSFEASFFFSTSHLKISHALVYRSSSFFDYWVIVHCMNSPQFSYSFYFRLILGLFPVWDSYKWSCCKQFPTCLWQLMHACLLDVYFRQESLDHRVFACSVWETWQLSKVFVPVTLPPETYESFGCVRSLSTLAAVNLFNFSHSSGHLMILICISLMTVCLAAPRRSS